MNEKPNIEADVKNLTNPCPVCGQPGKSGTAMQGGVEIEESDGEVCILSGRVASQIDRNDFGENGGIGGEFWVIRHK